MAYVSSVTVSRELAPPKVSAPRRSLWRRLFEAMVEARRAQAEREIAIYVERIGGKFTDSAEREIEHRFLSDSHR
jgi:hypothetical protein